MTKSGQKRKQHLAKQKVKRREKRRKQRLIEEGKVQKGQARPPKSA